MFYSITINRNCNFKCTYCYQKNKGSTIISDEIIDEIPNFIIQNALNLNDNEVSINISGGECLLYPEKVKHLITSIKTKLADSNFPEPKIEISTNISLLTNDIYLFLKKTNCRLFIGFDGIEVSQNSNRLYKTNRFSYNECMEKLIMLSGTLKV